MPITYVDHMSRDLLQRNPNAFFVFGDNIVEQGFGGQAAACRGEPNAIGIPTKVTPTQDRYAYFNDDNIFMRLSIELSLNKIDEALIKGAVVVLPTSGIGTGLAKLEQKAPKLYDLIKSALELFAVHYKISTEPLN